MSVFQARQEKGADTAYFSFKIVRSQLDGTGMDDTSVTEDVGYSPVSRWLTYALNYDDVTSGVNTAYVAIPAGTIVLRGLIRVDTVFVVATTVDVGDANQSAGWLSSQSVAATGVYFETAAVYNAGNASAGATGPQYYENGGYVIFSFDDMPTAGELILMLEVPSYNEPLSSEW